MKSKDKTSGIPWSIVASAFLLSFAMWGPMFCIPPIEHILKEQLSITHAQASLLYSAPLLMVAAVSIPGGLLADRIGVRKAAGIGAIIIALGTVLRATATNPTSLLAYTFIYGVGFGLSFPNLPKLVSMWVTREKSGVATGIFNSGMPTGIALALALTVPVILPVTNTYQGVFLIWGIPPVVAAILWWTLVKEPSRRTPSDETPVQFKVQTFKVFSNKGIWLVGVLLALNEFFMLNWAGWSPLLLRLKGATPELAGLITSISPWVVIPSILLMPRLSYRLGLRKPFVWIPSLVLILAAWGATNVSLSMSWPLMAAVGVANATRFITLLSLPCEMVSKEEVGLASGIILCMGYIGGGIGPFISGRILDMTGSLESAFRVMLGIALAATVIAFKLPETGTKVQKLSGGCQ